MALTNVTHRYLGLLADHGLAEACRLKPELLDGINCHAGTLTCRPVGEAHGLPFTELQNADAL
jgi:alanine dehydrogenase